MNRLSSEPGPRGLAYAGVVLVILMIAIALAAGTALNRELWLDEFHSAHLARMTLAGALRYIAGDVHPPLYFLLLREWVSWFGDSPFSLRAFSMTAFGLGGLALLAVARRIFSNRWLALYCFALFLYSPAVLYQATDARMYPLCMLWIVMALLFWHRLSGSTPKSRDALGLAIAMALSFYSHYMAVFTILALLGFWVVTRYHDRGQRRAMLLALAVLALLVLPWLPTLFEQRAEKAAMAQALAVSRADPQALSYTSSPPQPPDPTGLAKDLITNNASILGVFPARNPVVLIVLTLPFLVVCAITVLLLYRREPWVVLIGLVTAANIAGALLIGVISRRYLLMLAPFFILLIGLVVERTARMASLRWAAGVLAISILCLYISGTVRVYLTEYDRPTEGLIGFLEEWYGQGELIVFNSLYGQVPFDYQATRMEFKGERRGFPVTIYDWWEDQPFKGWGGPVIRRHDLSEFIAALVAEGQNRIWVVAFENSYYDPRNELIAAFQSAGYEVDECEVPAVAAAPRSSDRYQLFRVTRGEIEGPCPLPLHPRHTLRIPPDKSLRPWQSTITWVRS